ncbi:CheB methylesterase domain-containing protein [Yoonia sp.]|uniref:CheB methylesterase domain-containing protein n=1 Tax=Yoonia sp. TaxID=2212373 RepID=UPI003F6D9D80
MQVVIAHRSSIQKARLRARIQRFEGINVVRIVSELHDTYDYAEHHRPDCILICAQLANRPEFELLHALLRILGIGCVILEDAAEIGNVTIAPIMAGHVARITADAPDSVLIAALKQAPATGNWPPATSGQSQARHIIDPYRIILIGSSTGGVDALLQIISEFPADCPPTMIVQHTGSSYARSLIRLLDGATAARVLPARNGLPLSRGEIYLPPGDTAHLQLRAGSTREMSLKSAPPISGHRPSVDALFRSAVGHAEHVTAALLTGMGRDGAAGITELRNAGARTVGQDAATSVVYGMPRVAKAMGGIETELPLPKIGAAILMMSQAMAAS